MGFALINLEEASTTGESLSDNPPVMRSGLLGFNKLSVFTGGLRLHKQEGMIASSRVPHVAAGSTSGLVGHKLHRHDLRVLLLLRDQGTVNSVNTSLCDMME